MDILSILGNIKNKTKVAILTAVLMLFWDRLTFLHSYEPTQVIAFLVAIFGWADYQDGLRSKARIDEVSAAASEQVAK